MKTFETEWRARFERFARTSRDEAQISGWSETGLRTRMRLFGDLLDTIALPRGGRALDLGCGAGSYTRALARRRHRAIGFDYSLPSLRRAQEADPQRSCRYAGGEAYALPFRSQAFDLVVCIGVLQAVAQPERALDEMVRVLRDDGVLIVEALNRREVVARARRLTESLRGIAPRVRTDDPRLVTGWLGRRGLEILRRVPVWLPPRRLPRLSRLLDRPGVTRRLHRWPGLAELTAHAYLFVARRHPVGAAS